MIFKKCKEVAVPAVQKQTKPPKKILLRVCDYGF